MRCGLRVLVGAPAAAVAAMPRLASRARMRHAGKNRVGLLHVNVRPHVGGESGGKRVERRSADLFLATVRRMPTAKAEGLDRIGGRHRKGLGEARL